MKDWIKKYVYWGLTAFLVICASICFYFLLFNGADLFSGLSNLVSIFMPIIDGLILAYLMWPILKLLEVKLLNPVFEMVFHEKISSFSNKLNRRKRMISILLTVISVLFIIYLFFNTMIPQLIISIRSIVSQFPSYVQNLNDWVVGIFNNNPDLEATATEYLTKYSVEAEKWATANVLPSLNEMIQRVSTGLIDSIMSLARGLWNLVIGFIIAIYILASKERFLGQGKKIIYSAFNREAANIYISNLRFIHKTFIGFLGGKIVDSIIIGFICYFCIRMIGTPYPVLISVIIGVTNIIPFFGPFIGAIPSTILILMINPLQALYFVIFIWFLQQFDGNFLGPRILGNSTGLTSFWVIFSITIFGGLFGVVGMIIGVPVFAVIYAGIKAMTEHRLEERNLPVETTEYIPLKIIEEDGTFINYSDDELRDLSNRKGMKDSSRKMELGTGSSWILFKTFRKINANKKRDLQGKENKQEQTDNKSDDPE